jgi:hypothetical protein
MREALYSVYLGTQPLNGFPIISFHLSGLYRPAVANDQHYTLPKLPNLHVSANGEGRD